MEYEWQAAWQKFIDSTRAQQQRFVSELTGAWDDVASLLLQLRTAYEQWNSRILEPRDLLTVLTLVREAGKDLLEGPIEQYERRRPIRRALLALEEYESAVEELVRPLPARLPLPSKQFILQAGLPPPHSWWDGLIGLKNFRQVFPLRSVITDHLLADTLGRSTLDGSMQLLLARACLQVREPWHTYRTLLLGHFSQRTVNRDSLEDEWQQWMEDSEVLLKEASQLLEKYRHWLETGPARLSRAVLRGSGYTSFTRRFLRKHNERNLEFWSRQGRAVFAVLDLERQLQRLANRAIEITASGFDQIRREHAELQLAVTSMLEWLERWSPDTATFEPPLYEVRLLSLEERVGEWAGKILSDTRVYLPAEVEEVDPRWRLPSWRKPWRLVKPQASIVSALEYVGKPLYMSVLRDFVETALASVREMEHAREVVEYGIGCVQAEGEAGKVLLSEALSNARNLLLDQTRSRISLQEDLDRAGLEPLIALFRECLFTLEVTRVGLIAHLTRQRSREAATEFRQRAIRGIRAAFQRLWRWGRHFLDWLLLRVGWKLPPRPVLDPVVKQPDLGGALDIALVERQLPSIYRHLFRPTPVEDRSFLIGRDEELQGMEQALSQWNSGRFAAILLVGARGSGKTSLMNCACSSLFDGQNLVRSQFHERLTAADQMKEFLWGLFGLPRGTNLPAEVSKGRGIVILEELERAFLRKINGFEAIRTLLDLIHPTASNVLWVLSLNDGAFRYLDVAVQLGRVFSHRINAMSMKREDLISAILQRHNLSGLRLRYASSPTGAPRVQRLRDFLGLKQDPQKLFFDSLYEHSNGVFRSAFELWQASIVRVEGGCVEMRQPLKPDYTQLRSELDQMDHFTLNAIRQHGSLREVEVAEVFCEAVEPIRVRLNRLRAMRILEPDPIHPGIRVRPEADGFVLDTLQRVNLA